jgi:hypothetical protein
MQWCCIFSTSMLISFGPYFPLSVCLLLLWLTTYPLTSCLRELLVSRKILQQQNPPLSPLKKRKDLSKRVHD